MTLRVTLAQLDLAWEDKERNFARTEALLEGVAGETDLVVLPEMFSTGFSMRSAELAEPVSGPTVRRLKEWAERFDIAVCGSFVGSGEGGCFNRGFFISPGGEAYCDKRHLFRMGEEPKHYAGGDAMLVVAHKGFNIRLMICYDLRFPVWSRNVDNAYDLVVYVANWPTARIDAWNALLRARAIENLSYACGVNRCGVDGHGLHYNGNSLCVDFKGRTMAHLVSGAEETVTVTLKRDELERFRKVFPAWKDADRFTLSP